MLASGGWSLVGGNQRFEQATKATRALCQVSKVSQLEFELSP